MNQRSVLLTILLAACGRSGAVEQMPYLGNVAAARTKLTAIGCEIVHSHATGEQSFSCVKHLEPCECTLVVDVAAGVFDHRDEIRWVRFDLYGCPSDAGSNGLREAVAQLVPETDRRSVDAYLGSLTPSPTHTFEATTIGAAHIRSLRGVAGTSRQIVWLDRFASATDKASVPDAASIGSRCEPLKLPPNGQLSYDADVYSVCDNVSATKDCPFEHLVRVSVRERLVQMVRFAKLNWQLALKSTNLMARAAATEESTLRAVELLDRQLSDLNASGSESAGLTIPQLVQQTRAVLPVPKDVAGRRAFLESYSDLWEDHVTRHIPQLGDVSLAAAVNSLRGLDAHSQITFEAQLKNILK